MVMRSVYMNSKAKIIAVMWLLLVTAGIFAQQAILKELNGTVEFKKAGSAQWENAVLGQNIMPDTIISTGFKSSAVIVINNSQLFVRPLTRLSLTELSTQANTETVNVSLQTGRIRADVNPPENAKTSYTVKSPSATAAVRGTIFEVDVFALQVIEGVVEYTGNSGTSVLVDAGGISSIDEKTGRAILPEENLRINLNPDLPLSVDFISNGGATFTDYTPHSLVEVDVYPDYGD